MPTDPFGGRKVVTSDPTTNRLADAVDANYAKDGPTTAALNAKANLAGATFTGPVVVPTPTAAGAAATKGYVDSVATTGTVPDATSTVKGKIALAGDLTGDPAAPTVVGLAGKADTSALTGKADAAATTAALATKANLSGATFTGPVAGVTAAMVGALATGTRGAVSGVASLDAAQHQLYAEMPVGGTIRVQYATGSFRDMAGNALAARPTARTDLVVVARAPAGTAAPTWLINSDEYSTY